MYQDLSTNQRELAFNGFVHTKAFDLSVTYAPHQFLCVSDSILFVNLVGRGTMHGIHAVQAELLESIVRSRLQKWNMFQNSKKLSSFECSRF